MNFSNGIVKGVRRQTRKEGMWKFPAAFAAAMFGLSVFISLSLTLNSKKEAEQDAMASNRRIEELQEQQMVSNRVAQEIQIQELEHRIRSEQGRKCILDSIEALNREEPIPKSPECDLNLSDLLEALERAEKRLIN